MAKKPWKDHSSKPAAKKRKAASVAPKATDPARPLGTVGIAVQTQITVNDGTPFNELVIEWGCLGLSEEPDSITEISANSRLMDPKRPISTSEEGMHIYFDPPLAGAGVYGFQFMCIYNEAAEPRTSTDEEPLAPAHLPAEAD
jgi:hypothetical protein